MSHMSRMSHTPPEGPTSHHAVMLTREPIDASTLLAAVADGKAGGNVLFVGTTRGLTDGVATTSLAYDAHEPLAHAVLRALVAEARERFSLVGCGVVHRLGTVPAGEASVAVAASAPHRKASLAAVEWLMEQIKRGAPIWKCEHRPDGSRAWVHGDMPPDALNPVVENRNHP